MLIKNKNRVQILVAALAIFGAGALFTGNEASAYSVLDYYPIEHTKSYIDEAGDGITNINIAASCDEFSDVLDAVGNYQTNIYLTDKCSGNIVVGSGKKVNILSNYYQGGDGNYYGSLEAMNTQIPESEIYRPRYGTMISNSIVAHSGATLTVESGATVIMDGFVMNLNNTAVENHGTLLLMGGALGAVKNYSTLYVGGGNYTEAEFENANGSTFKIVDGFFGDRRGFVDANIASGVIVSGSDAEYDVKAVMPVTPLHLFDSLSLPVVVDIDSPYTLNAGQYDEIAEALLMNARSSHTGVLKISGSPVSGITFVGVSNNVNENVVGVHFKNTHPAFRSAGTFRYQEVMTYELPSTTSAARRPWINKVLNDQFGEPEYGMIPEGILKIALLNAGAIDITLNQYEIESSAAVSSDIEKLMALINNSGAIVAQYYDLSVSIRDAKSSKILVDLDDLGDDNSESVVLSIPEAIKNIPDGVTREFQVYHVHDGVVERLASTADGNNVYFLANKFSTYALAYKDTAKTSDDENKDGENEDNIIPKPTAPDTGEKTQISGATTDSKIGVGLGIALLMSGALLLAAAVKAKSILRSKILYK